MSLATLKKKTEATFKNVSSGMPAFSINGTRRGMSYIGQSTQSRHIVRKYIRDANHGGCCGNYLVKPATDGILQVNDYSAVKASAVNTRAFLSKCSIKCGTPTVKQIQFGYSLRFKNCNLAPEKTEDDGKSACNVCTKEGSIFAKHYGNNKKHVLESATSKNVVDNKYRGTYEDKLSRLRTQCSIQKYYKPSISCTPLPQ